MGFTKEQIEALNVAEGREVINPNLGTDVAKSNSNAGNTYMSSLGGYTPNKTLGNTAQKNNSALNLVSSSKLGGNKFKTDLTYTNKSKGEQASEQYLTKALTSLGITRSEYATNPVKQKAVNDYIDKLYVNGSHYTNQFAEEQAIKDAEETATDEAENTSATYKAEKEKLNNRYLESAYDVTDGIESAKAVDEQYKKTAEAGQKANKAEADAKAARYERVPYQYDYDTKASQGNANYNANADVMKAQSPGNKIRWADDNAEFIEQNAKDTQKNVWTEEYQNLTYANETERKTYNYILASEGDKAADEYLDYLRPYLNARAGQEIAADIITDESSNKVGREVALGLMGGIEGGWQNVKQNLSDEAKPMTANEYASAAVQQDIVNRKGNGFSLEKAVTQTAQSIGNMIPSLAVGTINPAAGAVTGGISSRGATYRELINEGYSKEQADSVATIMGVAEGVTSYLIGGISAVGGKLTGITEDAILEHIAQPIAKSAAKMGIEIISESAEELLQNKIQTLAENEFLDKNESLAWNQEDWDTLVTTALMTAILQLPSAFVTATDVNVPDAVETASGEKKGVNGVKVDFSKVGTEVLNNEDARTQFETMYGPIQGDSKTAQAKYITETLRNAAYQEQQAQQTQPTETETVNVPQSLDGAVNPMAQPTAIEGAAHPMAQAEKNMSATQSYVRGLIMNGEVDEILSTPENIAAYEQITNTELPRNADGTVDIAKAETAIKQQSRGVFSGETDIAENAVETNTEQPVNPALEITQNNAPTTAQEVAPSTNTETRVNPAVAQSRQFTESTEQTKPREMQRPTVTEQKTGNPSLEITQPETQTKAQLTAEEETFTMMRPPVNEDITSTEKKAQSHSIEGIAAARGFKYDGHTYMTKPEVDSLNNAAKRVSKDMPREITKLGNKDVWSGEDVDTAMTIANALFDDIAQTGDSKAFDSWIKVCNNHKTMNAQGLQAYAKWAKSPLGKLELIKKTAANIANGVTAKKDPKGIKQNAAAQVANEVTNAVNDAMEQVGNEVSSEASAIDNLVDTYGTSDDVKTVSKGVAKGIAASLKPPQTKTFLQQIGSMVKRLAGEKIPKKKGATITATDIISEFAANPELFNESWETVQKALTEYYAGNEAALETLNAFLTERPGVGTVTGGTSIMSKAVAETAVRTGETRSLIQNQLRLGYSETAISNNIADSLISEAEIDTDTDTGSLLANDIRNAAADYITDIKDAIKTPIDSKGLINSAMKDIGNTLTVLAKSNSDTKQNAYDAVSNLLIEKYGLNAADASDVVNQIQGRMNELVSERADAILQNRYGAKPTGKAKATFKEKLTEAVNLGAFDSQFADEATKSLFGIEGIKINDSLIAEYSQQTTDEGRDAVIGKMIQNIADQTPSTLGDKFNSLRYMAMLGNLKTLKNNLVGNMIGYTTRQVKDDVKSVIEAATYALSGGKTERTASVFHGKKLYDVAMADYNSTPDVQTQLKNHKKYDEYVGNIPSQINEHRKIWKFGDNAVTNKLGIANKQGPLVVMQAISDGLDFLMNGKFGGDLFWSSQNYADSLAGWMKANGITAAKWNSMVESGDPRVETARNYAIKQAQEATYRDTNALSEEVIKLGRAKGPTSVVVGGTAPFLFTPANVLARMEEYSPTGVINTAVDAAKAIKGTGDANQIIESAAKTLTGAGMVALGAVLAKNGIIRTKEDDDKLESLETASGNQDYSIIINGTSYSLDQFTPANVELFIGAEYYKLVKDDGRLSGDEAIQLLSTMGDVIVQTSMLKGVNDTIENSTQYGGDSNALAQAVIYSTLSYITQGLSPSLYKQIRQFGQENRQTTVYDSESEIPTSIQKGLSKAFGINQADYIDMWGRKQSNGDSWLEKGYNAFLGSTYPSEIDEETKAVNDALKEIYTNIQNEDDIPNFIPSTPSRNTEINKQKLTTEEYDTYAQKLGQTKFSLYQQALTDDAFKSLPYTEQAKILSDLSDCATNIAGKEIADQRGEKYEGDYVNLLYGEDGKATVSADGLGSYITAKDALNYFRDVKDYSAIDGIVSSLDKMPAQVSTALLERNSDLKKYRMYSSEGIGSQLVNKAEKALGEAQELDETSSDSSVEKFHGILLMDASDADKEKLINFTYTDENGKETAYLSKNWRNAYNIMSKYGYDMQTVYDFYVDSDYSLSQDDNGEYTIGETDGKLGPYEVGSALYRSNLPEDTQEQIFNDFVEASGDAGRYDNWSRNTGKNKYEKYTYKFIKYVFNNYGNSYGKQKFTLPSNAALSITNGMHRGGYTREELARLLPGIFG